MTEFKLYRRTQLTELRSYEPGEDMTKIGVLDSDRAKGSPKPGDMVVRDKRDPTNQWLVPEQYFRDNFAPAETDIERRAEELGAIANDERALLVEARETIARLEDELRRSCDV